MKNGLLACCRPLYIVDSKLLLRSVIEKFDWEHGQARFMSLHSCNITGSEHSLKMTNDRNIQFKTFIIEVWSCLFVEMFSCR